MGQFTAARCASKSGATVLFGLDLPSAFDCGFRAFLILLGYYPSDLARRFRPFVVLLLTRRLHSKRPRGEARRKALIMLEDFGCGGRI